MIAVLGDRPKGVELFKKFAEGGCVGVSLRGWSSVEAHPTQPHVKIVQSDLIVIACVFPFPRLFEA